MFMERDMGIFCNNFLELGDPNGKRIFGRGGGILGNFLAGLS